MTRRPATTTTQPEAPRRGASEKLPAIFSGLFGALLGLSLLKFGNPVIMEKYIDRPTNIYEWLFSPWPAAISYWFLGGVTCLGLMVARWKTRVPPLLLALPAAWLLWQFAAGSQTVSDVLTRPTLVHFTACVVCFYLGCFSLASARSSSWPFWIGLLAGFFVVLAVGFQQHFGGLESARRYYYLYEYPNLKEPPPADFIKKISTNRIFSTLFYPNTLAGIILLLLPATLAVFWSMERQFTVGARRFLVGAAGLGALACLFWSGSKGGWLLMLVLALTTALILPFKRQLKLALIGAVLVLGLAGFFVKYAGFFKRGATSVVARFDYWRAAVETAKQKPVFGTGPGTFAIPYERLKKPESEMARLTHNDYLQQASDSGVLGFLLYTAFITAVLVYTFRHGGLKSDKLRLAVWLGLLGWALQSTMEFGLYIPAIAWPAFCFMGWLAGQTSNQIDTRPVNH